MKNKVHKLPFLFLFLVENIFVLGFGLKRNEPLCRKLTQVETANQKPIHSPWLCRGLLCGNNYILWTHMRENRMKILALLLISLLVFLSCSSR